MTYEHEELFHGVSTIKIEIIAEGTLRNQLDFHRISEKEVSFILII